MCVCVQAIVLLYVFRPYVVCSGPIALCVQACCFRLRCLAFHSVRLTCDALVSRRRERAQVDVFHSVRLTCDALVSRRRERAQVDVFHSVRLTCDALVSRRRERAQVDVFHS